MTKYELKMYIKRIPLVKAVFDRVKAKGRKEGLEARRALLQSEGTSVTRIIEETLSGENVEFCIYYGSLLGLIRAGKFMDFDDDVDYAIRITEEFSWEDLERVLGAKGFVKAKQFTLDGVITEQTYKWDGLNVDFFGYDRDQEHSYMNDYFRKEGFIYHSSTEYHVSRMKMYPFDGVEVMELGGGSYHVPREPEKVLASIYKETWRIPDPNWVPELGPAWNEVPGKLAQVEYL